MAEKKIEHHFLSPASFWCLIRHLGRPGDVAAGFSDSVFLITTFENSEFHDSFIHYLTEKFPSPTVRDENFVYSCSRRPDTHVIVYCVPLSAPCDLVIASTLSMSFSPR